MATKKSQEGSSTSDVSETATTPTTTPSASTTSKEATPVPIVDDSDTPIASRTRQRMAAKNGTPRSCKRKRLSPTPPPSYFAELKRRREACRRPWSPSPSERFTCLTLNTEETPPKPHGFKRNLSKLSPAVRAFADEKLREAFQQTVGTAFYDLDD